MGEKTLGERLESAALDVEEYVQKINALLAEYRHWQQQVGLVVAGNEIVSLCCGLSERPLWEAKVRDFRCRLDCTEREFQQRLSTWAGLKTAMEQETRCS